MPRLTLLILFLLTLPAALRADGTTVTWPAGFDYNGSRETEFHLWIPPGVTNVKGIFIAKHGYGDNHVRLNFPYITQPAVRELAKKHDFAVLGSVYQSPGYNGGDWSGSLATFQGALADLASQSGHPEIEHAPWCLWGFSMGCSYVTYLNTTVPERIIGVVAANNRLYQQLSGGHAGLRTPLLWVIGETDSVTGGSGGVATRLQELKNHRAQGARWALSVDWGKPHTFDDNWSRIAAPFFDAIIPLRLPPGSDASSGPVTLLDIPENSGWLGDGDAMTSNLATVDDYASYAGTKSSANWFPNAYVARAWQAASTQNKGPVLARELTKTQPPPFRNDVPVSLTADTSALSGVSSVSFYDGDTLIGTDNTAPYELDWSGASPGPHALIARAQTSGGERVSDLGQVIIRHVNPPNPTQVDPSGVDLTTGLIAHWSFDEGSGLTLQDAASQGTNLGLRSANNWWSEGISGSALLMGQSETTLGATAAAASGPLTTPDTEITISAWVRLGAQRARGYIVNKAGSEWGADNYYRLGWSSEGRYLVFMFPGVLNYDGVVKVNGLKAEMPGNFAGWHHVAATVHNGQATLYWDGNVLATAAGTGGSASASDRSHDIQLGTNGNGGDEVSFEGMLDEVRIYQQGMTAAQIQGLTWQGFGGVDPGHVDPDAPTDLAAVAAGEDTINLSWTDQSSAETGYLLERREGGGPWTPIGGTLAANLTNYADTGLTAGTTYTYRLRAQLSGGSSSYSNEASAATVLLGSLIAYEGFDGAASGWAAGWTGDGLPNPNVSNLTFGSLSTAGSAANAGWCAASRDIPAQDLQAGSLWVSWLTQLDSSTDGQWRAANLIVNNGLVTQTDPAQPDYDDDQFASFTLGISGTNTPGESLQYNYVRPDFGGGSINTGIDYSSGTTVLHLIELIPSAGGMSARIWRYEGGTLPASDPTTGDATYVGTVEDDGAATVWNVGLSAYNVAGALDELRVANSWRAALGLSSSGSGFSQWLDAAGLSGQQALPDADPDGDGLVNFLEYALGGNHGSDDGALLPSVRVAGSMLELSFHRGLADLTYTVESSSTLSSWDHVATNPGNVGETVTVSVPLVAQTFLHLQVSD